MQKNNLKRVLCSFPVLIILFSVLAACGQNATDQTKTGQAEVKTQELNESAVLRFSFWGDPYEKKAVTDALSAFTKKTGIKVNPVHIPADYETKLTAMLASNDPPDAGYLAAPKAYTWFGEGELTNMNDFFKKDTDMKPEDFIQASMFYYDENSIIGLSPAIETYAIFYNKDIFDQAGLQRPPTKEKEAWTWEKFLETAKKLTVDKKGKNATERDFDPKSIKQYGFYMNLWFGSLEALLARNDAEYVINRGTEFGLDKPDAFGLLQNISDLMNKHHVMPSMVAQKSLPAAAVSLQTRKYAMTIDGQWALNGFARIDGLNFGIGVLPKFKNNNSVTGNSANVLFKKSKHPKEAWALLKYMADPSSAITMYQGGLWMPTLKSWYSSPAKVSQWAENNKAHPAEYKDVFFNSIINSDKTIGELYIKNFGEINGKISTALDGVWTGKKTAEQAMKELEPSVSPLCKGVYGK